MSRPRQLRPYVVAALLVVVGALVIGVTHVPDRAAAAQDPVPTAADGRTWLVDAIDDFRGNRWESVDTMTSRVTIQIGDTVEWRFDFAAQEHDLTSQDTGTAWEPALAEYRVPGDEPVRYTFDEPGTYEYLCSIHGTLMRGTVVVEDAGNRDPVATPVVEPTSGAAPLMTNFTANATDPDGDPLTYRWDFGTGEESTTAHSMYSYTVPGTYTATLEVSDGRGGMLQEDFPITVSGGAAPVVTAAADPVAGLAPLTVGFTGETSDAQGGELSYDWDFGVVGTDEDAADTADASYTYLEDGTYTATLTVTDGDGNAGTDAVEIVVGDGMALPEIAATATPASGVAPLGVAFSTAVSTSGDFVPFADGSTTYPDLAGSAQLVRRRDGSAARIDVTGLKPGGAHLVHVHEQACSLANGGAHFRFDEALPFAEGNEIWLPFTSDASGRSGLVEKVRPLRAGSKAVSVVIHDPDNPAKRIGCADLGPGVADLTYLWDFGDGTSGVGSDPDHVYAAAGIYTAAVTVGGPHAGHGGSHAGTVIRSVTVVVSGGTPADTTAPQAGIVSGPSGTVRTGAAAFRFSSSETGSTFECRLDGRGWDRCSAGPTFRGLRDGRHDLQVRAVDGAGNADPTPAVRRWTVDTDGPVIRGASPSGTSRDRTPTIRATVRDRHSSVRRRDLVLRIDGRLVPGLRYAGGDRVTWTPRRPLSPGVHTVRLVATDSAGNRSVKTWRFTLRR
jgi:PKD repeat protein